MYVYIANEVSPPPSSYKHPLPYSNHLIPPAMSNTFTRQALARSKDTLLDDLLQKPGTSDVETYNEVSRVYRNLEKSLITPDPEPLYINNLSRKDVDRIFSSLRNDTLLPLRFGLSETSKNWKFPGILVSYSMVSPRL